MIAGERIRISTSAESAHRLLRCLIFRTNKKKHNTMKMMMTKEKIFISFEAERERASERRIYIYRKIHPEIAFVAAMKFKAIRKTLIVSVSILN